MGLNSQLNSKELGIRFRRLINSLENTMPSSNIPLGNPSSFGIQEVEEDADNIIITFSDGTVLEIPKNSCRCSNNSIDNSEIIQSGFFFDATPHNILSQQQQPNPERLQLESNVDYFEIPPGCKMILEWKNIIWFTDNGSLCLHNMLFDPVPSGNWPNINEIMRDVDWYLFCYHQKRQSNPDKGMGWRNGQIFTGHFDSSAWSEVIINKRGIVKTNADGTQTQTQAQTPHKKITWYKNPLVITPPDEDVLWWGIRNEPLLDHYTHLQTWCYWWIVKDTEIEIKNPEDGEDELPGTPVEPDEPDEPEPPPPPGLYIADGRLISGTNYVVDIFENDDGNKGSLITTIQQNDWTTLAEYAPEIETCLHNICRSWTGIGEPLDFAKLKSIGNAFMQSCTTFNSELLFPMLANIGNDFMSSCTAFNSKISFSKLENIGNGFMNGCSGFNQELDFNLLQNVGNYFMSNCTAFNQILLFPMLEATTTYFMNRCSAFNQDISFPMLETTSTYFMYECRALSDKKITFEKLIIDATNSNNFLACASANTNYITIEFQAVQTIETLGTTATSLFCRFRNTNTTTHAYVDLRIPFGSTALGISPSTFWAGHTFRKLYQTGDYDRGLYIAETQSNNSNSVIYIFENDFGMKGNLVETIQQNDWTTLAEYAPEIEMSIGPGSLCAMWTGVGVPLNFAKLKVLNTGFLGACYDFNQPISVPSLTHIMPGSFLFNCRAFNQPLDLSSVISINILGFMGNCYVFNQPLNFSNATVLATANLNNFMDNCYVFNQPLNLDWSNVKTIGSNFMNNCRAFNQDISFPELISVGSNFMYDCRALSDKKITFEKLVITSSPSNFLACASTVTNYITIEFQAVQTIATLQTTATSLFCRFRNTNTTTHAYVNLLIKSGSSNVDVANRTWAGHEFLSIEEI